MVNIKTLFLTSVGGTAICKHLDRREFSTLLSLYLRIP